MLFEQTLNQIEVHFYSSSLWVANGPRSRRSYLLHIDLLPYTTLGYCSNRISFSSLVRVPTTLSLTHNYTLMHSFCKPLRVWRARGVLSRTIKLHLSICESICLGNFQRFFLISGHCVGPRGLPRLPGQVTHPLPPDNIILTAWVGGHLPTSPSLPHNSLSPQRIKCP